MGYIFSLIQDVVSSKGVVPVVDDSPLQINVCPLSEGILWPVACDGWIGWCVRSVSLCRLLPFSHAAVDVYLPATPPPLVHLHWFMMPTANANWYLFQRRSVVKLSMLSRLRPRRPEENSHPIYGSCLPISVSFCWQDDACLSQNITER